MQPFNFFKTLCLKYYALNFLAFFILLPSNTFSAPTFLPSLPQPYFGLNILQEAVIKIKEDKINSSFKLFMDLVFNHINDFISLKLFASLIYSLKPFCISNIVICNPVNLIFYFLLRYFFNLFSRYTCINTTRFANSAFQAPPRLLQ